MESFGITSLDAGLNLIVSLFIKALMIILTLLSLITLRQAGLMNRVVNVPIGGWFKGLASAFFWIVLVLTIGVVIIV